jgi:hypothetical protein
LGKKQDSKGERLMSFGSNEGYELEMTIRVRYKADPKNYFVTDNGDDTTAYEIARLDAHSYSEDPFELLSKLENISFDLTIAPVIHID